MIGKTSEKYLQEGIGVYEKRIKRYNSFELKVIPDLKKAASLSIKEIKNKEGDLILQQLQKSDFVILLDEGGKSYRSLAFAQHMQSLMNRGEKHLIFVCGGAYGFSEAVYKRAQAKLSLSPMTFSHQLVRLVFVEQLYRAYSILRNEPYHHE